MADPNTPSWLSEENTAAAAAAAPAPAPAASSSGVQPLETSTAANNTDDTDDTDPALPGVILTMRLSNMGVAIAMIVVSIIRMTTLPPVSVFVLSVYATCGGLLICCLETQLKFLRVMIAVNFGFLFHAVSRFIFYILMASVAWSFEDLGGKIVAACWVAVALFNTYVLCRYPSYRKMRDKIAEEEDKRIEARISKEVKKQAVRSVTGS